MDWTELANKHRRGDGLPKMIREPSPSDFCTDVNIFSKRWQTILKLKNMITVFSIGNAWKRSQLEIDSEIPYKILCEHLIPYQKEKLPNNIIFKVATGKKAYDLIRLFESGEFFFSQKIINVLSQFVDK